MSTGIGIDNIANRVKEHFTCEYQLLQRIVALKKEGIRGFSTVYYSSTDITLIYRR